MDRLKTFVKYILWIVGFSLLTYILTFVGLNSTYKNMQTQDKMPDGVTIDMAQSTSVNGRIYGKVSSTEENDLNGKYIKVDVFSKRNNLIGTKYLKLENLTPNESKKIAVTFKAENAKSYKIDIVDDDDELEEKILETNKLYSDTFTDEEMKGGMILDLVLALAFTL